MKRKKLGKSAKIEAPSILPLIRPKLALLDQYLKEGKERYRTFPGGSEEKTKRTESSWEPPERPKPKEEMGKSKL